MENVTGSPAGICDLVVPSFPPFKLFLSSLPYELADRRQNCLHYYLSEGLYFKIRGQMTIEAVFQVAQFLRLYSYPYFGAEPELLLEVDEFSTSKSVLLLQDNARISLLRYLCSEMSYGNADSLREILLNFSTLNVRNLFLWLRNFELNEDQMENALLLRIRSLRLHE